MTGQLKFKAGKWGSAEAGELYGLPILQAQADPQGCFGEFRLHRAGRKLCSAGALQVLVPKDFERWDVLNRCGVAAVDPISLLRAQGAGFALETLRRQGRAPERATVALRGVRAGRDMERTAVQLCGQVRHLVISAPEGGAELAWWLRKQYGMPILPPEEGAQVAVCFEPVPSAAETTLELYGKMPKLEGMKLTAPELKKEDKSDLSLLFVLWEGGILGECDLKIT